MRLAFKTVVVAALTGVLMATLSVVSASAQSKPTLSRSLVMAGEKFTISWRLRPAIARTVTLQYQSGRTWKSSKTTKTAASGKVNFSASTRSKSRKFRIYAPATTVAGKTYRAVKSAPVTVRTRGQSAKLNLSVLANGAVGATAVVSPGRAGRKASLQQQVGNSWVNVVSAKPMSSTGRVQFGRLGLADDLAGGQVSGVGMAARWLGPSGFAGAETSSCP